MQLWICECKDCICLHLFDRQKKITYRHFLAHLASSCAAHNWLLLRQVNTSDWFIFEVWSLSNHIEGFLETSFYQSHRFFPKWLKTEIVKIPSQIKAETDFWQESVHCALLPKTICETRRKNSDAHMFFRSSGKENVQTCSVLSLQSRAGQREVSWFNVCSMLKRSRKIHFGGAASRASRSLGYPLPSRCRIGDIMV